jgi:exonuclease III
VKGRFFNYYHISIYAPTNHSDDEAKKLFSKELEHAYSACAGNDVEIVMGDANIGRETIHHADKAWMKLQMKMASN